MKYKKGERMREVGMVRKHDTVVLMGKKSRYI